MNLQELWKYFCGKYTDPGPDEMNKSGKLRRGDRVILSGFGAGLTWAAAVDLVEEKYVKENINRKKVEIF